MKKDIFLSVIIPAYNEGKRIGQTLESVHNYLSTRPYTSEIVVVDDGSQDETKQVVEEYKQYIPNLRLLAGEPNHGKGYAVRRGIDATIGKWKLFMDADHSVRINYIKDFLQNAFGGYDVVIGSINHPMQTLPVEEKNGWHRRFLGNISKFMIRNLVTPGIYDTQRGFKLFSAEAARAIFSRQTIERFGFDIELMVIALENKFRIKELPVEWHNPAGSTLRLKDYVNSLKELVVIMRNRFARKYSLSFRGEQDQHDFMRQSMVQEWFISSKS